MKIIFFSLVIFLFHHENMYAQDVKRGFELSIGYGIAEQDQRLFEFAQKQKVLDLEVTDNDHQFEIIAKGPVFNPGGIISIDAGMGYSLFTSKFSRPFDSNYFPNERSYALRYIDRYSIHNIKLYYSINYIIGNPKDPGFSLILPFDVNINVNKNVNAGGNGWNKHKWNFAFYNFEIYSGLNFRTNRFNFAINYRILNYQEIDEVIFNQVLFKVTNEVPVFLTKDYEINNLDKILFTVSYKL